MATDPEDFAELERRAFMVNPEPYTNSSVLRLVPLRNTVLAPTSASTDSDLSLRDGALK